jgi:hypothetical protein
MMNNSIKGGANVTSPKSNRTYDEYLFEKEYKVPQRYPTPVNTASATSAASASVEATPRSDGLSRGTLTGAIVGSIAGGVLVGLGVFYLIQHLCWRARRQETGKRDMSQVEDLGDEYIGDNAIPDELLGHEVNEMGNVRASEMASHSLAEMWAEPAEIAGPAVSVREGNANDALRGAKGAA